LKVRGKEGEEERKGRRGKGEEQMKEKIKEKMKKQMKEQNERQMKEEEAKRGW
jgi:hypothetical protein